jgi:hypothetical protein
MQHTYTHHMNCTLMMCCPPARPTRHCHFVTGISKIYAPVMARRLSLCLVGTMLRLRILRAGFPYFSSLVVVYIVANDDIHQVSVSTKCVALPDYVLTYCDELIPYQLPSWERPPLKLISIIILVYTMYGLFWCYYLGYF